MNNTLLQITKEYMGAGDVELGKKLLENYLRQRNNEGRLPSVICFYNSGVQLLATEGEILNILKQIESEGVKLLACKTCLDHFGLTDKLQAGIAGSMIDIITLQDNADKIIAI